jgi:hypothetical protein
MSDRINPLQVYQGMPSRAITPCASSEAKLPNPLPEEAGTPAGRSHKRSNTSSSSAQDMTRKLSGKNTSRHIAGRAPSTNSSVTHNAVPGPYASWRRPARQDSLGVGLAYVTPTAEYTPGSTYYIGLGMHNDPLPIHQNTRHYPRRTAKAQHCQT